MVMVEQKNQNQVLLDIAIEEAEKGLAEGEIPIGSILVDKENRILGRGHNLRIQANDPCSHAETVAVRNAGRQRTYEDKILVTTLSPCWYCAGLVKQFKIKKVVIGESTNFPGCIDWLIESGVEVINMNSQKCIDMLSKFIKEKPHIWRGDIIDSRDV